MQKVKGVITNAKFILKEKFYLKINVSYIGIGDIFYLISDVKKIKKIINQFDNPDDIFANLKPDKPESLIGSEVDGIHYPSKGEVKLVKIGDVFANL